LVEVLVAHRKISVEVIEVSTSLGLLFASALTALDREHRLADFVLPLLNAASISDVQQSVQQLGR
jgi:hypothetical protein